MQGLVSTRLIDQDLVMPAFRCSIVACARWESPYILEWVNYHRHIGFDHIFLYCNDDDPAELFELLLPFTQGPAPFITFRHFLYQGQQLAMYKHFLKNFKTMTEWVAFLDIDEFMRLPRDKTVPALLNAFADVDALYLNWVYFGNNGYTAPPPGSVLLNYIKREKNFGFYMTKVLARTAIFPAELPPSTVPQHIWHYLDCLPEFDRIIIHNVLGRDMHDYYHRGSEVQSMAYLQGPGIREQMIATAVINHYPFKSHQSLAQRIARGTSGEFTGQAQPGTIGWMEYLNQIEDHELALLWSAVLGSVQECCITPLPKAGLISCHKPASQSSVSQWSIGPTVELDAAGAVDGKPGSEAKFHTAEEDAPWWALDLEAVYDIDEIRLFNRLDIPERAARLKIDTASAPSQWQEVFRKTDGPAFGGVDGYPLIWRPAMPVAARYIRIMLLERNFLHLNQVQVFGVAQGPLRE